MSSVLIEGRVLSSALRLHCAIIESGNRFPILSMVRLSVKGSVLTVTGTDLDIEAGTRLDPIDAVGEWAVCVGAKLLARIARIAGPEILLIRPTDDGARISFGGVTYDLAAIDQESFPELPGSRGEVIETFGNGSLAALLGKVHWCISKEETRYYLNGVCWQTASFGRRFVATDGHRLAICRYDADDSGPVRSRIIPRKTVQILRQFAAGLDVTAFAVVRANEGGDLAEHPTMIEFGFGQTTLRSKLIDGTYPDVNRVIPQPASQRYRITANRDALLSAVGKASAVRTPFSGRALRFHPDGDHLAIEMKSPDFGSASVVTDVEWPEGAAEFGLNGGYLADVLNSCRGSVTIRQIDAGAPMTVSDDDDTMTRVIMPMRV